VRRALAGLALLACSLPAALQADVAADIQARLRPFQTLHGRFQQVKQLQGIRRPLKSSGRFVVERGQGVLWICEKPLASQLRVSAEGLAIFAHGQRQKGLDGTGAPQHLIGQIALSVFSSDIKAMQEHFGLSGSVQGRRWSGQLRPKDAGMARAIQQITLTGSAFAEGLTLQEANGDVSHITFSGVKADQPLSAEEKALFE